MAFDYDLFVIGAGSGGVRASRIAAGLGARVAVAEDYRVGGTCVIRGCVPKKLFVYASEYAHKAELAKGFGWTLGDASFDWPTLVAAKDKEIDRLNGLYLQTLAKAGVEVIMGRAVVTGPHSVSVDGKDYTAEKILIAVGAWPMMPNVPGIEHAITSNEAFHLETLPEKIVIVGGGYIAVEFAGIFNGMGRDVSMIYRGDEILRGFDEELRPKLAAAMTGRGVDVRCCLNIDAIEKTDTGLRLTFDDGSTMDTGMVMYATGRTPKTKGLGLEAVGVALGRGGEVIVDDYSRTTVPSIFAVGDVTNRAQLTPVAIKEGHAFALTEFGGTPIKPEHDAIPTAVFSQPQLGTVGLTEEQAKAQYDHVKIFTSDFRPMKHTLGGSDERGFYKMVVDGASDRVLGVHLLGEDAGEIIQAVGIAVKNGLTKAQFDATVAVHPSSAEELVLMREPTREHKK